MKNIVFSLCNHFMKLLKKYFLSTFLHSLYPQFHSDDWFAWVKKMFEAGLKSEESGCKIFKLHYSVVQFHIYFLVVFSKRLNSIK